jgi:dipeptidyl-peptidase 4
MTMHPLVRRASLAFVSLCAISAANAQQRTNVANWALSNRFSDTATMRRVSYSTTVTPNWINGGDSLWYAWRDRAGCNFYVAYPRTKAKTALFDQSRLAAQLSTLHKKPFDPTRLPFTTVTFAKDAKTATFTVEGQRYEWTFASRELKSLGKAIDSTAAATPPAAGRGGRGNAAPTTPRIQYCGETTGGRGAAGLAGGGGRQGGPAANYRNYSPDSSKFVYGQTHNVYLVTVASHDTVQLSKDGETKHSFTATGGFGQQQDTTQDQNNQTETDTARINNRPMRVNADWAPDSKAFYVRRTDNRRVHEICYINSLTGKFGRPEPVCQTYAMPGDEEVPQQEVWLWRAGDKQLSSVDALKKWRDQQYFTGGTTGVAIGGGAGGGGGGGSAGAAFRWESPTKLRLIRRDRLQRHMEYVEYDIATGAVTPLVSEAVDNANIEPPNSHPPVYVSKNGDFLWWSERSGWGHFYLYDHAGKLKSPITSGEWRADTLVALDSAKRIAYIKGEGREAGENPYYRHLYRVALDGGALTLMDPGNAMHTATPPTANAPGSLSASHAYYVDNASRTDLTPKCVIRDEFGKVVMDLETTDMTSLKEMGWKPSEPFVVKSADGVTDIWGNLFKPFDFDSTKKYPIIAHVYPGPQTESITFGFTTNSIEQRLANLGFIVIQIGNRGGSPDRSNAYQSFSYFNMRDYGLADKKSGIEQLAARYKWIDIDRAGIFGHSGGGFMTAAAMMLPPYNEFFKVGVSSSGNHDNNIYNLNWSEQYHGLAEVISANATANTNAGGAEAADGNSRVGRGAGGGAVQQQGSTGGRGAAASTALVGSSSNANISALATRVVRVDDTTRYEIRIPTNAELAPNLKGDLLLAHGDQDNNVTPSGTIRLMDALIKANKRFDFIMLPGQAHGYGPMQNYFNERLLEYFCEHLLGDYYRSTGDMNNKKPQ